MSDLCSYYTQNPDPQFSTCRNTGLQEDGVTFDGFEPLEGIHTYIGRSSIVEACGLLFEMTPKQVVEALTNSGHKALRVQIGRLEEEKKFLADRLAQINDFIVNDTPTQEAPIDGEAEPVIA